MKNYFLSVGVLLLGSLLFASESESATYAGQACQSTTFGSPLSYLETGAKNVGPSSVWITCPIVRTKDSGTAAAAAVIYFVNDASSKTCFLDNFSIDTGSLALWTSTSGVSRLALPTLSPTLQWAPLTLNCSLPPTSKVNGYFIGEA